MPASLRFVLPLAACVLLWDPAATPRSEDIATALDRYTAGEYAGVRSAAAADPDGLVRGLERSGPAWIAAEADQPARRLIAAAFALEAADALVNTPRRILYRRLVDWGCAQVRRVRGDERAIAWRLAAVSLLLRARDWPMLKGPGPGHLRHAREAAPDEPRFLLADAVIDENQSAAVRASFGDQAGNRRLIELTDRYRDLAKHPVIAPDAWLRLGMIRMRLGESQPARAAFSEASRADDPHVRHLAHFLLAVLAELEGRRADALRRLRAALRDVPRATTASAMATALLILEDRADEATVLTQALFTNGPPVDDPWRLYASGPGRFWESDLAKLREALRP
jgi:tetratricopeptide (TPR) repeat protein